MVIGIEFGIVVKSGYLPNMEYVIHYLFGDIPDIWRYGVMAHGVHVMGCGYTLVYATHGHTLEKKVGVIPIRDREFDRYCVDAGSLADVYTC